MRAAAPGQPRRPLLRQAAKGRRTGRSRGENRDEVAGPPDQVLVGRAGLAGDGGSKTAPWSRCDIQLDPFGIDVELHGSARAGVHEPGARTAMELDINPEWVQLDVASGPGHGLRAAIPGQARPADQYLLGWTRDFITVLAA